MAADTPNTPSEEEVVFTQAGAGAAFRTEMAVTNFFIGYWPYMVGALGTVLVSILIWGQYHDYVTRTQKGYAEQIYEIERTLPGRVEDLPRLVAEGSAEVAPEKLSVVADKLSAFAESAGGAGELEAELKAAELYRLAKMPEKQRQMLEKASANASGVLAYAASSGLANLDIAEGRGDEAITRFTALSKSNDRFLAIRGTLELAQGLESLQRNDEAIKAYDDFLSRFADAPEAALATARRERLAAN